MSIIVLNKLSFTHIAAIYENLYRRYVRNHAVRPLQDAKGLPTALLCPSGFARRVGEVVVGTSSGLVHVWRLPEAVCQVLLPPPLPMGQSVGVTHASFHSFVMAVGECDEDVGSPCWDLPPENRPGPLSKPRRFTFVWIFYDDGRAAIWEVDRCLADQPVLEVDGELQLCCGDYSGLFSYQYLQAHPSLLINRRYRLHRVFE